MPRLVSHAFQQYWKTSPNEWDHDVLLKMPANELMGMCELLGVPTSGTRSQIADRLITLGNLRVKLTAYAADRDGAVKLAADYKGKELKAMARTAGCWLAPNKLGLAIGLINWREKCRKQGQKYLAEARERVKEIPKQRTLDI